MWHWQWAGFTSPVRQYRLFFPGLLRALRRIERCLAWLPLERNTMWQHGRDNLVDRSAPRFVLIGMGNALVGLLCIYAGKWLWQLGSVCANLLVGVDMAYLLNLAVVVSARDVLHLDSYLAHALGVLPYTVCGYLGSRHFAFPQVPDTREHIL
jgi:putative flippase GtrA